MISRSLLAAGQWDLTLDDPPERIRRLSARNRARLLVTPEHLGDPADLSLSGIEARAMYAGVLSGRGSSRTRWRGYGLPILLGGAQGGGNAFGSAFKVTTALPFYDGANDSWFRKYIMRTAAGGANGLTIGNVASAASPTKKGNVEAGQTPFSLLSWARRVFSSDPADPLEFRITPAGAVDVRVRSVLWPTTASGADPYDLPTAASSGDGKDLGVIGLVKVEFSEEDSWDEYRTDLSVVGPTVTIFNTPYTFSGSDSITSPYVGLDGNPLIEREVLTTNNADSNADCEDLAEARLPRLTRPQRRITLTTDLRCLAGVMTVGDTINLYSHDDDLFDRTRQMEFNGVTIFPTTARCTGAREPCRADFGYYLHSWNGSSFDLTDVSEFVAGEDGPVTLEVGEPRRHRPPTAVAVA